MYYSTPFSSPGLVDGKLVNASTDYPDLRMPFTGGRGMGYYGGGFMRTSNNTLNADVQLKQKLDFITKGLSFHIKGSYNSGLHLIHRLVLVLQLILCITRRWYDCL